jgi:hypothetical protein
VNAFSFEPSPRRRTPITVSGTDTAPCDEHQVWDSGEPVVALRQRGTEDEWDLVGDEMTLGRAGCDISIPASRLSERHCYLRRSGSRWLVVDAGSMHGTFVGDLPRHVFELSAGAAWRAAATTFVAVSSSHRRARKELLPLVGYDSRGQWAADSILVDAISARHFVIRQPPGGQAHRVAAAIHLASHRRGGPFVALKRSPIGVTGVLRKATRGTLVVARRHLPRDEAFMQALAEYRVRLVLLASDDDELGGLCGGRLVGDGPAVVGLTALTARRGDLAVLVRHLVEQARARFRLGEVDLDEQQLAFVQSHDWPRNVEELERFVERALAMRAADGNMRRAAKLLGISAGTLGPFARDYPL